MEYLCKPGVKFLWTADHEAAFQHCKAVASNSALFTHFDPAKPLVLTTNASPYGVGACLSYRTVVDNKTRLLPIAYVSSTLKEVFFFGP